MKTTENHERRTRANMLLFRDRLQEAENSGDDDDKERMKRMYQKVKTHWSLCVLEVLNAQKHYNMTLYNYYGEILAVESERDGGMETHYDVQEQLGTLQVLKSLANAACQTTVVKESSVLHERNSAGATSTNDDSILD
jgi:hypothetical protein